MYEVSQSLVVARAKSYAEALAEAHKFRGHGYITIRSEAGEVVATMTPQGKLNDYLAGPKPSYRGEQ